MKLEATAFKGDGDGTVVIMRIQPGAKRSSVCGMYGDAVKVAVQAPPVDGRANAALREFLAARLRVPQRAVTLLSGQSGRDKRLRIAGRTPEQVQEELEK